MSTAYQIVVCAGIVPDPLQTLEPARQFTICDCRFEENGIQSNGVGLPRDYSLHLPPPDAAEAGVEK